MRHHRHCGQHETSNGQHDGYLCSHRIGLLLGTEIVVEGYQSKDGAGAGTDESPLKANGRNITFTDGRKLFLGSSGTGAPRDGTDPTEQPLR